MPAWIEGDGSLRRRLDAISFSYRTAYSPGPEEVGDASLGLLRRVWRARLSFDGRKVLLSRSSVTIAEGLSGGSGEWEEEEEILSFEGAPAEEIDLAFEQLGRTVLCLERATGEAGAEEVWLYRFDPSTASFVLENLGPGRGPRLLLDDPESVEDSDVLLFFVSLDSTRLEMRQQRELYEVGHILELGSGDQLFCEEVARARDNRLHVILSARNLLTGKYRLITLESVPYPVRDKDAFNTMANLLTATLTTVLVEQKDGEEAFTASAALLDLNLLELLITFEQPVEEALSATANLLNVELVLVLYQHTQFVEEALSAQARLVSVTLVTTVIEHNQPVRDAFRPSAALLGATLVAV